MYMYILLGVGTYVPNIIDTIIATFMLACKLAYLTKRLHATLWTSSFLTFVQLSKHIKLPPTRLIRFGNLLYYKYVICLYFFVMFDSVSTRNDINSVNKKYEKKNC